MFLVPNGFHLIFYIPQAVGDIASQVVLKQHGRPWLVGGTGGYQWLMAVVVAVVVVAAHSAVFEAAGSFTALFLRCSWRAEWL